MQKSKLIAGLIVAMLAIAGCSGVSTDKDAMEKDDSDTTEVTTSLSVKGSQDKVTRTSMVVK